MNIHDCARIVLHSGKMHFIIFKLGGGGGGTGNCLILNRERERERHTHTQTHTHARMHMYTHTHTQIWLTLWLGSCAVIWRTKVPCTSASSLTRVCGRLVKAGATSRRTITFIVATPVCDTPRRLSVARTSNWEWKQNRSINLYWNKYLHIFYILRSVCSFASVIL